MVETQTDKNARMENLNFWGKVLYFFDKVWHSNNPWEQSGMETVVFMQKVLSKIQTEFLNISRRENSKD